MEDTYMLLVEQFCYVVLVSFKKKIKTILSVVL